MIKKFKVNISKKTLKNIYKKIRKFPFNNIQNMDGWLHGTNHDYLKNISKYWISKFNWKLQERKINKFNNKLFFEKYFNTLGKIIGKFLFEIM